jgi:heat shock protein HtpX
MRETNLLTQSKLENILHSIALLGTMFVLLLVIGWVVAGTMGMIWAVVMGAILVISGSMISSNIILRLYQARLISVYQAPELYEIVARLSNKAGLEKVPLLYYFPSQVINAFATGHNGNAHIAISDGLLRALSVEELAGVLGHEISHLKHNDLWVMNLADILSRLTAILAFFGYLLIIVFLPFYFLSDLNIPWLALILLWIAPHISALLQMALSRNREYGADIYAAELTGNPLALASALRKIEMYQGRWLEQLLFPGRRMPQPSVLRTHPKLEERVRRLHALAEDQYKHLQLGTPIYLSWPQRRVGKPRRRFHGLWY